VVFCSPPQEQIDQGRAISGDKMGNGSLSSIGEGAYQKDLHWEKMEREMAESGLAV